MMHPFGPQVQAQLDARARSEELQRQFLAENMAALLECDHNGVYCPASVHVPGCQ